MFGDVKLTNNPHKYGYSNYHIGFSVLSQFMLSVGQFDKSVLIFGVNNSSWVHADNRKKEILVIGEGTMDGLDDPSINQLNILLILLSIEIKFI